jgi:outer membrane protein OmpA-like peptidoglycan-associated protein
MSRQPTVHARERQGDARLVKDGIKAKITVSGKGHAKPVASNKTKRGRALNRRVVVKFTL